MSATVLTFPSSPDEAWDRYAALVRQSNDDPRLREDRQHVQRTILAHKAFEAAFLRQQARA